jgi:ribosomal-protein-alanine N-acetyltransferase
MHEIERESFSGPERLTSEQLSRLALRDDVAPIVVEVDGFVQGFALVHFNRDAARLLTIDVAASHRRRGLGRAMLDAAGDAAAKGGCVSIGLEVSVGNAVAIALYEKAGYAKVGRLRDYYPGGLGGGSDAFEMVKNLSRAQ